MKNLLGLREIISTLINKLTLTAQNVGFTISGGTTSKTLTVNGDATVSGINTGDDVSQPKLVFATANFSASGGSYALSVPPNPALLVIAFDHSVLGAGYSILGGRVTVPSTGNYRISATIGCRSTSTTDDLFLNTIKNGTVSSGIVSGGTNLQIGSHCSSTPSTRSHLNTGNRCIFLNTGDTVSVCLVRLNGSLTENVTIFYAYTSLELEYLGS